jgi:hypothetical protein
MKECCVISCPSNSSGTNDKEECILSGKMVFSVNTRELELAMDPDHCSHYAFKMRMGKDRDINATI